MSPASSASLYEEVTAVDEAASRALDLVAQFLEQDPADSTSCWKNPHNMLEQLDAARRTVMKAWQALEDAKKEVVADEADTSGGTTSAEPDFRAQFMDMVTTAFADVLAGMKDQDNVDLDILVDCLQSGMDLLSPEDKEFLFLDSPEEEDFHAHRRRELGFVEAAF